MRESGAPCTGGGALPGGAGRAGGLRHRGLRRAHGLAQTLLYLHRGRDKLSLAKCHYPPVGLRLPLAPQLFTSAALFFYRPARVCCRYSSSSGVLRRASGALRWGKRPKRCDDALVLLGERQAVGRRDSRCSGGRVGQQAPVGGRRDSSCIAGRFGVLQRQVEEQALTRVSAASAPVCSPSRRARRAF